MSTYQVPWDIYAEQLLPVGYGHPLWIPEPNEREVELGDVGWLKTGEFRPLFNSMKPEEDPVNREKGAPVDFKVFNPQNLSISTCAKLMQKMVYSRSIHTTDAQGNVGAGTLVPPVSTGAGIKFQSTSDSGAFVLLDAPAQSRDIESKRHIVNYMLENLESWLEFANASYSWGLDLKEQDIIFVCGTTKTTRWAVAAFQGNTFSRKEGYVMGDFGPFASGGFSVHISNQVLPATHYRHGPQQPRNTIDGGPPSMTYPGYSDPSPPRPPNQCLFVHYYKMKRRWWPLRKEPMQAAGGPHQLPRGPDDPGMDAPMIAGGAYEFGSEQGFDVDSNQGYDPVNVLLEYILAQSLETEVAIASDLDLYAVFADRKFPGANGILEALEELKPTIEVDERGVGTISIDSRAARKRRNDDPLPEEEHIQKRVRPGESPCADPSTSTMSHAPQVDPVASMLDTLSHLHAAGPVPPHDPVAGNEDVDMNMGTPEEKTEENRSKFGGQTSVHDGSVTALTYSTDGSLAASGSEDTYIFVWELGINTSRRRLEGHADTVSALAFSPSNAVLASASHDKTIIIWDVVHGKQLHTIVPGSAIHSLVYTPDGSKLVAGASDGKLYVWNAATYQLEKTIEKNSAVVTFIVFSKDGRRMATGGGESVCYIWETAQLDAPNPEPLSVLDGHRGMVHAAAFSPDGERVVTASDGGSSRIWKAHTGQDLVFLHEHTGPVWSVAFSPDGKRVASGSSDSTVMVCDSYSGERILSLYGHDSMINVVEFSPDGQWIASAASDNTVRLWKASDGVCTTTFNEHNDNVTSVMFSPDGLMLASGSHDGMVRIRPVSGPYHVEA